MDITLGCYHAVCEEIEYRSAADAQSQRKTRSAGAGSRIILAQPVDIGKTQDEISAGLLQHDSVILSVPAKNAVWVLV